MEEKQSNIKGIGKAILKLFNKKPLILLLAIGFVWFGLSGFYVKNKDDFDKVSETNATYTATVNANGQIQYTYKDPDDETAEPVIVTTEQIAEELKKVLAGYIDGDDEYYQEKIQYIMGAEAVTRMPYVEQPDTGETSEGGGDDGEENAETPLQGQIKFYRYSNEGQANYAYDVDSEGEKILKEEYRLTYVTPEEFETLKTNYESSGEEKVFEHFTMNDEGNVVIACGSKETRTVKTENDLDLTLDLINENSTEDGYSGNCNEGFSMVKYTIIEKPIDYISLVEQYIMPANLLYSLLIQTRDIKFVEQVASLAYDNEIAIAIYDNMSVTTRGEDYAYQKVMGINGSIELDFSRVEITDPTINSANLRSYSLLRYGTEISTYDGKIQYSKKYYNPSEHAPSEEANNMYIAETNNAGKITALGAEGENYTTTYTQVVEKRGQPTVGVVLADTWIARWEATYKKVEDDSPQPSPSSGGEYPNTDVIKYNSTNEVINAFAESMNISTQLDDHANRLKQEAIETIIAGTNFEVAVEPESISRDDLDDDDRRNILRAHINRCSTCTRIINVWWQRNNSGVTPLSNMNSSDVEIRLLAARPTQNATIQEIYSAITRPNGELKGTTVEAHYWDALDSYVERKNAELASNAEDAAAQRVEERKDEVRTELENQIDNSKELKGTKKYVNITYTPFFERDASNYEKGENLEPTKLGEKFSKVFNNDEFYDSRQAILYREEWLWEYIRANEDTAKIEDVIRILLNEATDSKRFGDLNINDILKAFEPENMTSISSLYGDSIETKIWCALLNEGYTEYAIAGVLGNLYAESGIRTNNLENSFESLLGYTDETYTEAVNEGMYNNGQYTIDDFISDHTSDNCGAGYGLAQWTYCSRKEGLYNYALNKGVSIDDEDMQIEYLIAELTSDDVLSSYNGYSVEDWLEAGSPEDAATAFCWIFEKPGSPHMSTRLEKAREYYEIYKDFDLGGAFVKNTSGEDWIIGEFTSSITGRTFTIFDQTKIVGWERRCNRAAQISVCSGYWSGMRDELIDNISSYAPQDASLYERCGLTVTNVDTLGEQNWTLDKELIKEQILSGGYVIVYVRGTEYGWTGESKYPPYRDWAGTAHWVAILGYREMDSTREIYVSDSAHGHSGWVPWNEFDGILRKFVFVNEK